MRGQIGKKGDFIYSGVNLNVPAPAPAICNAFYSGDSYLLSSTILSCIKEVDIGPRYRWADGGAKYCGFGCVMPPNGAQCSSSRDDWFPAFMTASSRHPGRRKTS